jgi:hypothetical protein
LPKSAILSDAFATPGLERPRHRPEASSGSLSVCAASSSDGLILDDAVDEERDRREGEELGD